MLLQVFRQNSLSRTMIKERKKPKLFGHFQCSVEKCEKIICDKYKLHLDLESISIEL